MALREKLRELFKEDTPPELDNKARTHRYESINHLNNIFKQAVIQAATDIPDDCKEELNEFLKHAWKAYVIAMSTHDMHIIAPRRLRKRIGRWALTKLYEDTRASCNLDAFCTNDEA